jgi:S-adenosylmethionine/arginine decarboxylase-like enzyme
MKIRRFEREVTIALYNVENFPDNIEKLKEISDGLANLLDVKIVKESYYQHSNGAISASYIIEESSINIDPWPEYKTVIVRVSTCNPDSRLEVVADYLKKKFCAGKVKTVFEENEIGIRTIPLQ